MDQEYLTDLPEERFAKYRWLAAHARNAAHNAVTPEAREAYMSIATAWETMAAEFEHARQHLFNLSHKAVPGVKRSWTT